jgi:hypothetical protein
MLQNKNVRAIENGWLECWEEAEHAFYYFHPDSGSTQWEHPSNSKVDPDLVFRRKRFKFLYILHQNMKDEDHASMAGSPQRQPVLPLTVDRQQIVFTSYTQLRAEATDSFVLVRTPKITFVKEEGIDSGGVSKDWFLCLTRAFSDPQLCLFRTCNDGGESLCLIDSRSSINTEHLEYFRFVGRILGMVRARRERERGESESESESYPRGVNANTGEKQKKKRIKNQQKRAILTLLFCFCFCFCFCFYFW